MALPTINSSDAALMVKGGKNEEIYASLDGSCRVLVGLR